MLTREGGFGFCGFLHTNLDKEGGEEESLTGACLVFAGRNNLGGYVCM